MVIPPCPAFILLYSLTHSLTLFITHSTLQEKADANFPADSLKLIHSGKILNDDDVVAAVGIKENDFLVVMIAKKKTAAPKTPKEETSKTKEETKQDEQKKPAATTTAPPAAASHTETPAPTRTATPAAPTQPPAPSDDEAVANLTAMGFPEEAVRHCLRVAQGNPDLAVEFLTNGIPEGIEQALAGRQAPPPQASPNAAAAPPSSGQPLQALRNHPQFNDLRRLVQTNPQMLQQVLAQIGQQQPELLQEINANQALFLQMMNEPVTETNTTTTGTNESSSSSGGGGGAPENPFLGMGNPLQVAQMIQGMNPDELNQMAQMMGISSDQLRNTAHMIGSMPPEQLNQFLVQAMGAGGGGEGMGGPPQVLRLSDEEMAAVDRLTEMGFDRAEAAQAFLACDKNEAMAANLLMDSMMNDDHGPSGGGGDNNNNNNDNNNDNGDDEEMYD